MTSRLSAQAVVVDLDDASLTEVYGGDEIAAILSAEPETPCHYNRTGHAFIGGHCCFCGEPGERVRSYIG